MKKKNTKTVGAFDAKTHLSQLLEEVQEGNEITISKRGKPIARLIPFREEKKRKASRKEILEHFDAIRKSVNGEVDIKSYIKEGRDNQ